MVTRLLYLILLTSVSTSFVPELKNVDYMILGFNTFDGGIGTYDYPVFEPLTIFHTL